MRSPLKENKMKCLDCGGVLTHKQGEHQYTESGLDNVFLTNITISKCRQCKEEEIEIPRMKELNLMIGFWICLSAKKMTPDEARFLRKNLGFSAEKLADTMGVDRVTVTRWETSASKLSWSNDKHLRRIYWDKKQDNIKKLPDFLRMVSSFIDSLTPERKNKVFKISPDDWHIAA